MEEMYHSVSQQLDEERKRRSTAVQTLSIAENSNADLKQKLKAEEQARKSAEAALKGAEMQEADKRGQGTIGCVLGASSSNWRWPKNLKNRLKRQGCMLRRIRLKPRERER